MSIKIEEQHITLNTRSTSYQMAITDNGFLLHLYYGSILDNSYADSLAQLGYHSFSPIPYDCAQERFSPDISPLEYPAGGSGDFRTTALRVEFPDGSRSCDLRFSKIQSYSGKPTLKGLPALYGCSSECETLELELRDTVFDLRVILLYTVFEKHDIISRSARIINNTGATVHINAALSACLDWYDNELDFITFYGKHAGERSLERKRLGSDKLVCESVRGASGHQKNPFVIVCRPDCTERQGECWGSALVYSGNFCATLESSQIGSSRLTMGINPQDFRYTLDDGDQLQLPEVIHTYSESGFGKLSRSYHRIIRNNLCRGEYQHQLRPVLINNWEATYFKFNAEKLIAIAGKAREIGADTFVLDDGWFLSRNNDRSSLGDWYADEEKLGCPLSELIERIRALKMNFGIWFEPECISENSNLFRTHPDWCLHTPGKKPALSRNQWVLDFSNPDVVDGVFGMMKKILDDNCISYIKWDFNRHLSDVYSSHTESSRQGETAHRYMLGVYELLERLHQSYPGLLIEGCSGGGGRFDCGMLYYTPQIWTSDNTDPICRLEIQYGTSFCYPPITMGSHVTASPNHLTHRQTPLKTRSSVAMAGTYGFELDLTKLTADEIAFLNTETEFYRRHAGLVLNGDYYRLTPCGGEYMAWEILDESGNTGLITAVQTQVRFNCKPLIVKPEGLSPEKVYNVIIDGKTQPQTYTGCALMKVGIQLSGLNEQYASSRIEIIKKNI